MAKNNAAVAVSREEQRKLVAQPAPDEPAEAPARRSVQSITRALEILEALASEGGAIGITDVADRVDLPLPTIHRILRTLVDAGYVLQTPRRQYALSARLITLSRYAGGALGVSLRPLLTPVVDAVGESASIAMLDQDYARYISHVPTEHSMRMFTEIGNQVSLHATGVGKAILSVLPMTEVQSILRRSGMRRFTANTITEYDALLAELEFIRSQGYARDREEHELGVSCIAVPIPGTVLLSVSVSGPPSRLSEEKMLKVALPALQVAAAQISEAVSSAMTLR